MPENNFNPESVNTKNRLIFFVVDYIPGSSIIVSGKTPANRQEAIEYAYNFVVDVHDYDPDSVIYINDIDTPEFLIPYFSEETDTHTNFAANKDAYMIYDAFISGVEAAGDIALETLKDEIKSSDNDDNSDEKTSEVGKD